MHAHRYRIWILICIIVTAILYVLFPKSGVISDWWRHYKWNAYDTSCLNQKFKDILLVIIFNYPHYAHIPLLQSLYNRTFPNMVFCGAANSSRFHILTVRLYKGYFGYECLAAAIDRSANYTGYLVMSDDILLNFWNLPRKNASSIWEGPSKPIRVGVYEKARNWYWWRSRWGLLNCLRALNETKNEKSSFHATKPGTKSLNETSSDKSSSSDRKNNELSEMRENFEKNLIANRVNETYLCHGGRSDIFYLPRRYTNGFTYLSRIFRKNDVFIEIAVPTIFRMLELTPQIVRLTGVYLPGRVGTEPVANSKYLWENYSPHLDFIHPVKLHYGIKSRENIFMLNKFIRKKIDGLVDCSPGG